MSSGINQRLKFLVTPIKHGGEYRSIDLKKLSFTPPASKRALVPSPFLVIGKGAFDIHSVAPDQCIFSSKML